MVGELPGQLGRTRQKKMKPRENKAVGSLVICFGAAGGEPFYWSPPFSPTVSPQNFRQTIPQTQAPQSFRQNIPKTKAPQSFRKTIPQMEGEVEVDAGGASWPEVSLFSVGSLLSSLSHLSLSLSSLFSLFSFSSLSLSSFSSLSLSLSSTTNYIINCIINYIINHISLHLHHPCIIETT